MILATTIFMIARIELDRVPDAFAFFLSRSSVDHFYVELTCLGGPGGATVDRSQGSGDLVVDCAR